MNYFFNIKIVHNSLNCLELLTQTSPSVTASCSTVTGAMGFLFLQNLGHFSFVFFYMCMSGVLDLSNLIVTEIQGGPFYVLTSVFSSVEQG